MPVPAAVMALAPYAAPVIGSAIGAVGSAVSSAFNVGESRANRRFQERMSSTAHQREVADLRAAGLNPLLSSKYGGSSTPAGSMTQIENPLASAPQAGAEIGRAALSSPLIKAQVATQVSQADLNSAQAAKVRAETKLSGQSYEQFALMNPVLFKQALANLQSTTSSTAYTSSLTKKAVQEALQLQADLHKHSYLGKVWQVNDEFLQNNIDAINRLGSLVDKASGPVRDFLINFLKSARAYISSGAVPKPNPLGPGFSK